MKTKSVVVLFFALSILINSCNMPGTPPLVPPTALPNSEVAIEMYGPFNGSIYSTGELIYLNGIAKKAFDSTQLSRPVFLINGNSVEATLASNPPLDILNGTWTSSDPGEYYIQAKVTLGDGSTAISEPHRVCVMPTGVVFPSDWGGGRAYLGPCPLATHIPNSPNTGNTTMDVVANPSVIWATLICSDVTQPLTPAITFVAHVNDPQDLVALVHVSILGPGGGPPLWNSYLN
jgi:hypothetical protein